MGVFDDKKFEQLDWMTQVTETIDSELNGLLARLPDEKTFNMKSLLSSLDNSYSLSFSLGSVVRSLITDLTKQDLGYEESRMIAECFELQGSPDVEIDFTTMTMTGELRLVKVRKTIEDEDLQKIMGNKGISEMQYSSYDDSMTARANEILDMLDVKKEDAKARSIRKKMNVMRDRLKYIFRNNEYRIRDMELANKLCRWCADYVKTGNGAAFINICKLKVMTHNEMPVYSVEEEL